MHRKSGFWYTACVISGMKKALFVCLSFLFLAGSAWADYRGYYSRRQHARSEYESDSYYPDSYDARTPYVENYPVSRDQRPYSEPGYGESSEGYYSCPRGDYISDRPGRCPLDGALLVPRGSSEGPRSVHYRGPQY